MSAPRVCVIGDLLADTDVVGHADRLSPEVPVPVVDEDLAVHRAGGAGLAATLAARAGATVTLVTALADDEPAERLRSILSDERVGLCELHWTGTTVEKIRIRAAGVPMLRLDRGSGSVSDTVGPVTAGRLDEAVTGADAVLVADYGRGVAAHPLVRRALAGARELGVPVVWDPHPRGTAPLPGTTLACPNRSEAESFAAAGLPGQDPTPSVRSGASWPEGASARAEHDTPRSILPGQSTPDRDGLAAVVAQARGLRRQWEAVALAVTMGGDGAVVVLGDGAPLTVPVLRPVEAGDTCGAGDAFAAAAAVAMARGAVVSEAVQAAVDAAAAFVAAGGAAGVGASPGRAPSAPAPTSTGTVVATGGCFDILHPGHVHTIRAARRLGDRLVVLVNDDGSVGRLKGPDRPLQPVEDRCAVLESLADVDEVVVFGEDTPVDALRRLRPDVFVKGGDYTAADIPETAVLAEWGGTVVTVPFLAGRSTTELVSRARATAR